MEAEGGAASGHQHLHPAMAQVSEGSVGSWLYCQGSRTMVPHHPIMSSCQDSRSCFIACAPEHQGNPIHMTRPSRSSRDPNILFCSEIPMFAGGAAEGGGHPGGEEQGGVERDPLAVHPRHHPHQHPLPTTQLTTAKGS